MASIDDVLRRAGGIASLGEFERNRVGQRSAQRACDAGTVLRVRRGWYAARDAPGDLVRASRVGGSLACVSGAVHRGLWEPPDTALHVSVGAGARHLKHPDTGVALSRLSPPAGVVLHWDRADNSPPGRPMLPLIECIRQTFACQPAEIAFTMLESALRLGLVAPQQLAWLEQHVAAGRRAVVRAAGALADSGTESLFRYRLGLVGVTMRSQVEIPGVGRVDFVIGDRLAIEIDSEAHHGGAHRRRDLARDAILAALGFVPLRFDYRQVIWDWATVEMTVLAMIERREHLTGRR